MSAYIKINDELVPVTTEGHPQYYFKTQVQAEAALSQLPEGADVFVEEGSNEDIKFDRVDWKSNSILGAKNLIPFPYYRPSGYTSQGMTATYDENGVITVNKVAGTSTAYFALYLKQQYFIQPNTSYILSLELENATNTSIYVNINNIDIASIRNKASGYYEVRFTTGSVFTNNLSIGLYWPNTGTETNAIVKPMIRLANDTDRTFCPYVPTNKELNDGVYKHNSVMGAKNLIPYPYYHSNGRTSNGITYTVESDGTIIANGTATANSEFDLSIRTDKSVKLPIGEYILSGAPNGTSMTTYYMWVNYTDASNTGIGLANTTNLSKFQITESMIEDNPHYGNGIGITIMSGQTVKNLVFKPMIRLASDADSTYQPYAMTNKELTDNKLSKSGGTVTGTLVLSKTTDASGTANNSPALIVGGTSSQTHLEFDGNEITAKSDETTPSTLSLNNDGGAVYINNKVAARHTVTPTSGYPLIADGTNGGIKTVQTLPVGQGGTGATTIAGARNNLDVPAKGDLAKYALLTGAQFTGDVNVVGYVSVTDGANYRGLRLGAWNNTAYALNVTAPIQSNYGPLELCSVNGYNSVSLRGASVDCRNYENTAGSTCWASAHSIYSSRRYKENIKELTGDEAKKILDVSIVSFDYKKDAGVTEEENRFNKTGVIAEDIVDICPEVVEYKGNEIEGVDYSKLVPRLIKLVQIQEQRIAELEAKVNIQTQKE